VNTLGDKPEKQVQILLALLWKTVPATIAWPIKHKIPFHGVMMGKGGADVYIDNKAQSNFTEREEQK